MSPATVKTALEAAEASQPTLNAFISIDGDARSVSTEGLLASVPIGLKDIIEHAGRVNTCGSAFYRHVPDISATCVQRLEDAGGVIIGRTNLHEWAFGFNSENEHWGAVRNPWDTSTSAGGSSGGSGAAVAAGLVPLAIGTDTGGSVRVPAALCGTYGLKVSHGAIPIDGVFPLVPSIDTVGPLANSMELIERAYRVMAADHRPLPEPSRLRIGVPQPWVDKAPMSDDMRRHFEDVIDKLRDLGHTVEDIGMDGFGPSRSLIDAIGPEVAAVHSAFRQSGEEYGDSVEVRIAAAENVTEEEAGGARKWQDRMRVIATRAFREVDVLVTPTVPDGPKVIGEDEISGHNHRAVLSYFTAVVNHALLPALAAPLANTGTPPASIQVIGDRYSELALIALGHELERTGITGFQVAPPNSRTSPVE